MKPWEEYSQGAQGSEPLKPWEEYDFELAVGGVLKSEGGYANDPDDRGGETKYGISKASYPHLDIPSLSVDDAKEIYKKDYWQGIGAHKLPAELREVAFDAAVNQGVGWTKRALARAGGDVKKFLALRARRYAAIVRADPTQAKFQRGWEKRLEQFQPRKPWEEYGT